MTVKKTITFFDEQDLKSLLLEQRLAIRRELRDRTETVYSGIMQMCVHENGRESCGYVNTLRPYCWLVTNNNGVGTLFFVDKNIKLYGIYYDREKEEWDCILVKK